jgi:hypothetical protein
MRALLLFSCVLPLNGCSASGGKTGSADSADDSGPSDTPAYDCTTDANGWVSCEGLGWDDQVDADGLMVAASTDDLCAAPYNDSYNGWLCAVAGVLMLKAQTFGVDPSDYSTDFADVFDKVQQFWVSFNNTGGAESSIGDCPDSLRDSTVFHFTWCDRPSSGRDANMALALNTLQDCLFVHPASDRADVGIWTGVSLLDADEKDQDDLWLAVFWSMLRFHTASTLIYGHDAGTDGTAEASMAIDISGLEVRPEWSAEEASALGLSDREAAGLIQDFVDDPIANTAPEGLHVRLRFKRLDFADSYNGAASWPGTDPLPVLRSVGSLTAGPWHLGALGGSPPVAIIDPVVDDPGRDAASDTGGDTGASSGVLGASVKKDKDELSYLSAFVASARLAGWSVAFGDED